MTKGFQSEWPFRRVFSLLYPDHIEHLLRTHATILVRQSKSSDQIAVDSKTLHGRKRKVPQCLHSVSAWCHENGLVLVERQVDNKSNEVTDYPFII